MHRTRFLSGALPLLGLLAGCARESGGRHSLSGTVTFRGQPVAAGQIVFEPDVARGNDGPGGFAVIHQGRYQTEPGMGMVGGPHILRFTLGDGNQPSSMQPYGKLLVIDPLTLELNLPRSSGALNLEIPEPPSKKEGSPQSEPRGRKGVADQ